MAIQVYVPSSSVLKNYKWSKPMELSYDLLVSTLYLGMLVDQEAYLDSNTFRVYTNGNDELEIEDYKCGEVLEETIECGGVTDFVDKLTTYITDPIKEAYIIFNKERRLSAERFIWREDPNGEIVVTIY